MSRALLDLSSARYIARLWPYFCLLLSVSKLISSFRRVSFNIIAHKSIKWTSYCSSIIKSSTLLPLRSSKRFNNLPRLTASLQSESIEASRGFIDSVSLEQWGVFEKAEVNFSAKPSFIAITGETGSGKSVFIAALEYICGQPGSRSLARQFDGNPTMQGSVTLQFSPSHNQLPQISKQPQQGQQQRISRVFDMKRKLSQCDIDGERRLVKDLSAYLSDTVRFWSTEAINKLESAEFMNYIDGSSLSADDKRLKREVQLSYSAWKLSIDQLQKLNALKERASSGDEFGLLSHYSSEMSDFETQLEDLLTDLESDLECYGWRGDSSTEDHVNEVATTVVDAATGVVNSPAQGLLDIVFDCLTALRQSTSTSTATNSNSGSGSNSKSSGASSSSSSSSFNSISSGGGLDYRMAWDLLIDCESFYRKLAKVMKNWTTFSAAAVDSTAAVAASSFTEKHDSSTDLSPVIDVLADYGEVVLQLKRGMKQAGVLTTAVQQQVEDLYEKITLATEALKDTQLSSDMLSTSLPDVTSIVNKLLAAKSEWEKLARKHSCHPRELGSKKQQWSSDLRSLVNLDVSLPRQAEAERIARLDYGLISSELSQARYRAAERLIHRVNRLLPKLEMADKRIGLEFWTHIDPTQRVLFSESQMQDIVRDIVPTAGVITENGWDYLRLTVQNDLTAIYAQDSAAATDDDGEEASAAGSAIVIKLLTAADSDRTFDSFSTSTSTTTSKPAAKKRQTTNRTEKSRTSTGSVTSKNTAAAESTAVEAEEWMKSDSISKILSSGECARLALALETIAFSGAASDDSIHSSSDKISSDSSSSIGDFTQMQGCLIFDEIDAHLGGEAAVSVARLLKQQGKVRQVIAVTHNPVIAAAADKHIVVERMGKTNSVFQQQKQLSQDNHFVVGGIAGSELVADHLITTMTATTSATTAINNHHQQQLLIAPTATTTAATTAAAVGSFPRSCIVELHERCDRERELARMATGNLQTAAGVELARALLDIDFNLLL